METELGLRGEVARVTAVAPDGLCTYLELRSNRQVATVTSSERLGLALGEIVIVDPVSGEIALAPPDLWSETPWIGVVKLRRDDITVLYGRGELRSVRTSDEIYAVGNTVEADDTRGVLRVLSDHSLSPLESDNATSIDQFVRAESGEPLTFGDFGGLEDVVRRAKELIEVPLEHHETLTKIGARPIKGVLFTGPPGTGKTLLARIVASQAKAKFYEISGPRIVSKYVGDSELQLRRIFEDAAKQRSIIFFDEIDSVAGQRDGDSHEASRRLVAQLLTLMDGFLAHVNVVVIAATNRPDDIDRALRRPGRFDWEIAFPLPEHDDRISILTTAVERLVVSGLLDHEVIAGLTDGWSAAELSAIWTEAALLAVADGRSAISQEDYLGGFERTASGRTARTSSGQGG